MVEVSTDAGITGWGDAFGYVCPRTTYTAIDEMIAPQARGQEVPDAAGIPAFMEQIQRNLHLFGRYGITMFAISALDIALWDLAASARACRCIDCSAKPGARRFRPMRACCGSAAPDLVAGECETALQLGYGAIKLHETTTPAVFAARAGDRRRHSADGRHELPDGRRGRDRIRACLPRSRSRCFWKSRCGRRRILRRSPRCAAKGGLGVAAGENACTAYQFRQMMRQAP